MPCTVWVTCPFQNFCHIFTGSSLILRPRKAFVKHGWADKLLQFNTFLLFTHSKYDINSENKLPYVFGFIEA